MLVLKSTTLNQAHSASVAANIKAASTVPVPMGGKLVAAYNELHAYFYIDCNGITKEIFTGVLRCVDWP